MSGYIEHAAVEVDDWLKAGANGTYDVTIPRAYFRVLLDRLRTPEQDAVLAAADEWLVGMDDHDSIALAAWEVRLRSAVRARRVAEARA